MGRKRSSSARSSFGVTGIPPTEKHVIASRGDAYRDYQKRVSKFIPLPLKPRSVAAVAAGPANTTLHQVWVR